MRTPYRLAFVSDQLSELVVAREPSGVRRLPQHAGHMPKLLSNGTDPNFKQGFITPDELVRLAREALGIEVHPPVGNVRIWMGREVDPDGASLPVMVVEYPSCCQVSAGIYRKIQTLEVLEVLAMHELYLLRATLAPGLLQEVSSLVRAMAYLGNQLGDQGLPRPCNTHNAHNTHIHHIHHIAPVQALHSRSEHVRMA